MSMTRTSSSIFANCVRKAGVDVKLVGVYIPYIIILLQTPTRTQEKNTYLNTRRPNKVPDIPRNLSDRSVMTMPILSSHLIQHHTKLFKKRRYFCLCLPGT